MKRLLIPAALAALFTLGLAIRLYDLTDPPFDFQRTRQMRSAIIARGMYYADWEEAPEPERTIAVANRNKEALIEPPIVEWLTSRIYLLSGAENLWVPRALSSVFWLFGGAAVFGLAREITGSRAAALVSLAYFLFLPYAMKASRSFQPDPLMTALIAGSAWALYAWARRPGWWTAACAGIFSGLAILTKAVAVFPIGFGALAMIVFGRGIRRGLRDPQVWMIAALSLLPFLGYYINGLYLSGFLAGQNAFRFFPQLWLDPAFYIRWVEMATGIAGYTVLTAGLVGLFLIRDRSAKALLAGLWLGYVLYSFTFPYHTMTHDYYQLVLIPIAAVSLAPPAALVAKEIADRSNTRFAAAGIAVLAAGLILFQVWDTRVILARQDYRPEIAEWARFNGLLPEGSRITAVTQAYGYPLAYYGWVNASVWISTADSDLRILAGQTEGEIDERRFGGLAETDYVLVTNFNELDRQPALQEYLEDHARVYMEGQGFVIYELNP